MQILSWNIQCGLGCDGNVDLDRIAREIRKDGDPDVICLQEVSRFFAELDGGRGGDQLETLAALFPEYEATFGAAVDFAGNGKRRQFGNLLLSRVPPLQVLHHLLPQPAEAGVKHMRRQATEVVIADRAGPLRIVNTHLEFHSARHRLAQVERLRDLQAEVLRNDRDAPLAVDGGPYASIPRPPACLMCGDFNFEPQDSGYAAMTRAFDDGGDAFVDCWPLCHSNRAHDATCGLHDRDQWKQGPHCRDFFFANPDLAARVLDVAVDQDTDASDHQPLHLRLAD